MKKFRKKTFCYELLFVIVIITSYKFFFFNKKPKVDQGKKLKFLKFVTIYYVTEKKFC